MEKDLYQTLGVSNTADASTIKKAYRKLAMKYHPDQNPGDKAAEDKFKEAAEAYEILSDENKRARYDQYGMAGVRGGASGGQGFHDASDIFSAFGDIFGDFFGGSAGGGRGQGRTQRRGRGADLRYGLEIDLEDVLTGKETEIEFDAESSCGTCSGSGAKPGSSADTCGGCGGRGQVLAQQGFFSVATTCPQCGGKGKIISDPCKKCEGQGRVETRRRLEVKVPKGVDTGTRLRLSNEGEGGYLGGEAGDLYVEVYVRPHRLFKRQENHLLGELKISYLQAILGAEVEAEGLKGPIQVKIPKGTQTGELLRISGEGLPSLRSARSGDLHFQVEVVFPKKLDKKEEKLLREIAEIKKERVAEKSSGLFG